ncbi:hypothetical protein HXX76_006396 [Chlamydomonas incerta]|uniref:Uncharacterized protein n=1 Tax=Chlamydomonas incerta TaxID=51695 RepID=A0A835T3W1_CHLIN|nr:hypothetical protein HXX76_006396 [Chlamydomonas incerta]|eukprot:KAG2436876.1 hypothetical protein HXX76_006396 [Chlamydomonas incerta]
MAEPSMPDSSPTQDVSSGTPDVSEPRPSAASPTSVPKVAFPFDARPLASLEEALSEVVAITTDASRLLPAVLASLFAVAWPAVAKAWTQPMGTTVRIVTAGALTVMHRLSQLAAAAASILVAGGSTSTSGLVTATSKSARSSSTLEAAPTAVYDVAAANAYLVGTAVQRHAVLAVSYRQVLTLAQMCTRTGQPFVVAFMYEYGYTSKPAAMDEIIKEAAASGSLVIACTAASDFPKRAAAAADLMGSPQGWNTSAAEVERLYGLDVALASRLPGARNRGIFTPVIGWPAVVFGGAHLTSGLLSEYNVTSAGCELPLSAPLTLRKASGVFAAMQRRRKAAEAAAASAARLLAADSNFEAASA